MFVGEALHFLRKVTTVIAVVDNITGEKSFITSRPIDQN
jgi:hypothetical protein